MAALGRRLRALREARQWSLKQLGGASGVSVTAIRNIERGQSNPSLMTIMALVDCLGVSIDQLIADAQSAAVQINVTRHAPAGGAEAVGANRDLTGDLDAPAMRAALRDLAAMPEAPGTANGEAVFGYVIDGAVRLDGIHDTPTCGPGDAFHLAAGSDCHLRPADAAEEPAPRLLLVSAPVNGNRHG